MEKSIEIKMEISQHLAQFKEPMPEWLRNYKSGDAVSFAEFMQGRVGYYPGSGYDGMLISLCNRAHCVHSFLYVDYGLSRKELCAHLNKKDCLKSYHSIGRVEWSERDLMPSGSYPSPFSTSSCRGIILEGEKPYCFMEIFERNADCDDSWGAERFAVTFLFADGIATYYQLFAMEYRKAPWIFLLQDHGFGGNYDRFGKDGLLNRIMTASECWPKFVLCDKERNVWSGYSAVEGLNPAVRRLYGHRDLRYLFSR